MRNASRVAMAFLLRRALMLMTSPTRAPQITKRATIHFQPKWYQEFPWLHFKPGIKGVFCHVCLTASRKKLFPSNMKLEPAFLKDGFHNWKDGRSRLLIHQNGNQHRDAVIRITGSQGTPITQNMGLVIAGSHSQNREVLRAIFSSVKYLAKQGLPIRGHEDHEGNFHQLIRLRSREIPILLQWPNREKNFMSGDILNEMCEIMAHRILRSIIADIKSSGVFSLIIDETTDCSTKEQLSFSIRYARNCLEPEEMFLGMYEVQSTTGEALTNVIVDVLRRFDLPLKSVRGQCYDGAANMQGHVAGVQARIKNLEPRALYVHCANHSLNLALQDAARAVPLVRDLLQYVNDVAVVIKRSPKRLGQFKNISIQLHHDKVVSLKALCPTRWCVRVESMSSFLRNYEAVLKCLGEIGQSNDQASTTSNGLLSYFEKWESLFALNMCIELFGPCDRLAKLLQRKDITVSGAVMAADQTTKELVERMGKPGFANVWKKTEEKANLLCLDPPRLPRKRSRPARYQESLPTIEAADSVEDHFYKIFEETFGLLINEIDSRFNQSGLVQFSRLEKIILEPTFANSEEFLDLCTLYELDSEELRQQLSMFIRMTSEFGTIDEAVKSFKDLNKDARIMLGGLEALLKLLVVIPASTATAERSFSMLRRLKTYLRSTMLQSRLNHLTILNWYKDMVDDLDIDDMMREFVNRKQFRVQQFGKWQN